MKQKKTGKGLFTVKFKEELEKSRIPFDLLSALHSVLAEFGKQKFKYDTVSRLGDTVFTFKRPKALLTLAIQKENLFVRQYSVNDKKIKKVRVIYVVKPSERNFKLRI